MFCRYCGEKLYEDAFFCTNCGMSVNQMDLPARKVVSTPGAGTDAQETSETIETICEMQPETSVELKTETQERVDLSVEPEVSTQLSTPLQETVTEAAGQGRQETTKQPESAEETAVNVAPAEETVTEVAGQGRQETTKQPESAEVTAVNVAPAEEIVTEAAGQRRQETTKQPESPEASASAAATAAKQPDGVPHQAISAGGSEFSQTQKPRERSNAVLIIVTIVAAVLFLVGVWGAIYFSSGDDELFYSRGNLLTETGVGDFFSF